MSASNGQDLKRTYRGNCHCAAFVYEVELPEIKRAGECNCSVCAKKAALWASSAREDFRVVKGAESGLSNYNFGSGQLTHKFCGNCGTAIMVDFPNGPPGMKMALNVRSIQDLDIAGLERKPFDGASLGPKYEPPVHQGPNPTAEVEGGKLQTGSCHCGAVTVAVVSKPINETYEGQVIECDCRICERNGYIWLYLDIDQVVLSGDDDSIGRYAFSHRILSKTFCKICGVPLTNQYNPLTEEERSMLTEDARHWHNVFREKHPVNARVLNGVDWRALKTQHSDGKTQFQPGYVNP
ncbi:Centromere protein V [Colletotrichum shisoi]|uniref:Centromere protein V n=1 Tax=Colletotrichum shisoi TaxID=2078593 RepID=A0A5Q4C0B8_9PEZI|nr:Centromere protein V [Colletotrichum shisoi]